MCGFICIIQNDSSQEVPIFDLLGTIEHRGPDDWGWLVSTNGKIVTGKEQKNLSGNVILAHRRLSIIDLSQDGWQPMSSSDGNLHLTYNGELYNYIELRTELIDLGYEFISNSDTEVLLTAWKHWGKGAVKRFIGMFAFSIFDSVRNKLFIVRDFFGIKPAYFCKWENGIAFASEQKPLLMLSGITKSLNDQRVYEYLRSGLTEQTNETILSDIQQIPPATIMEFDVDEPRLLHEEKYWQAGSAPQVKISFDEAVKKTRELFLESVDIHLRSDVRVGAALSGGIDSSAIVCAIRHLRPEMELHTFTYVAGEKDLSEEDWADIVIEHANAIPHKIKVSFDDLITELPKLVETQFEPFGSSSIYAQYKVFEKAKQVGVTVMLDGQGADEILAGYVGYQGSRLSTLIKSFKWIEAFKFISNSSIYPGRNLSYLAQLAAPHLLPEFIIPLVRKVANKDACPQWMSSNWIKEKGVSLRTGKIHDRFNGVLRSHLVESVEYSHLPHLLRYEDRNSMIHSIESRVPFLVPEFANFLLSLPEEFLISKNGESKFVFREAMRGIVPDVILNRQDKVGFETPHLQWSNALKEHILVVLDEVGKVEFLNMPYFKAQLKEVKKDPKSIDELAYWRILNILLFIRNNIFPTK